MKFLLCAILLPLVTSSRLTPEEDREFRKTCGRHYFRPDSFDGFHYKMYGGRRVQPMEYPWLVSLYHDDNSGWSFCTGVIISPRHILTAAHCVIDGPEEVRTPEECRGHRNKRNLKTQLTWISDRKECPVPNVGQPCKKHLAEVRTVHPRYNECTKENDLALLEMSSDLPQKHLAPICMPSPREKLSHVLQAAGSGYIQPKQRGIKKDGYNVVNMTLLVENSNRIKTETSDDASACPGDSGGPLFQSDAQDIHTLVGILASTTGCDDENTDPLFTHTYADVRKYLKWICKVAGVCYPILENENYNESEEFQFEIDFIMLLSQLRNHRLTYPW